MLCFKSAKKMWLHCFCQWLSSPIILPTLIEWFTPFRQMDPNIQLYYVSCSVQHEQCLASVIDVEKICHSCHLFPNFGPAVPQEWKSSNVLDHASSFLVNPFVNQNSYVHDNNIDIPNQLLLQLLKSNWTHKLAIDMCY